MRKYLPVTVLACCLVLVSIICGCCMCWDWPVKKRYERMDNLSASMAGIEKIKIDTGFGEVKIKGEDTTECKVIAKISGEAPTMEEAQKLVEQTKITLEEQRNILVFIVDKPSICGNRSIGVSYDVVVPVKTGVNCVTSFGEVKLKDVTGDVDVKSSFGKIKAENITGRIILETSYGEVDCRKITSGEFRAKSSFGKMDIEFSDACPADLKAYVETSFGEIIADIPKNFAGDVAVETSFGSIKTDLPITVKGDFGKDRLAGTIGQGKGKIDLKTSFGSVKIK